MNKLTLSIFCAISLYLFVACGQKGGEQAQSDAGSSKTEEAPDSMIFGLTCDGTNDTVIVFLPFTEHADPVTYNIEEAKKKGMVIGQPAIGDWVGLLLNPVDSTEATMVVNLDQLKGTWTYEVKPTWKDASKMSARALRRKMAELPDSLRETYLVPREYGFVLKRSSVAQPVGRIMRSENFQDDSPVEYPEVRNYVGWKCRNGKLVLTYTDGATLADTNEKTKEYYDTLQFVSLTEDSLVLLSKTKGVVGFHRKENALSANAAANAAAEKNNQQKAEKLK